MGCWYCGEQVFETWQTRFGDEYHDMPMCIQCASFVRVSLFLRDRNIVASNEMANELDNIYGIDTRRGLGYSEWIQPSNKAVD